MSTSSFLTSISCLNLNYYVEHHDFPKVPWSRLPQVKALAPTFYDRLEQSICPGHTIWMGLNMGTNGAMHGTPTGQSMLSLAAA